ncbi:putative ABC transport system ATP-binding protein [Thermosediminibacter litoriperuensis]|uniref:Putative ABC transport system ATP-binding protein n=1 Tax=Thermosediminibacter litoriperuensis TaxID=291989 RepID=A0A5S5AN55_9FIRM|nr:ABC transporter ATP-binding protein [Thermosediminibacter litoriperuensis]TYP52499.1 putative ABC transport system ATP-binding protein [Thermosediminibacter litoriperuensis]
MATVIELIGVSKVYGKGKNQVPVLDDINLKVDEGEFVAVLGPSGSGKTTLMNILGLIDTPTSGSYIFEGKPVSELKDRELAKIRNRKIGFVFQSFNLIPDLDALENVELPLIYAGVKPAERQTRAAELLDLVGLSDRTRHRPSEMSGGQQQRVAIARALAADPPLILADEPTGNLDSRSGAEVMNILESLNGSGKTVILITHDREIAARAKRKIEIRDGKIVRDERVKD